MSNPFDGNFFKFLGGFILILGVSFAVLFITQKFASDSDAEVTAVIEESNI